MFLPDFVRASSLTSDTASGNGHYGSDVLERHLVINGSWITDGGVSELVGVEVFGAPRVGIGVGQREHVMD